MLLVFDIGNSNIVLGTYEGKRLMKHWRISTDRQKTGDEYGMLINDLFRFQGIRMTDIDAIIISSVVPPLVVPLVKMCERYFHLRPLIVGPGIKTGIRLRYENPREIGADRIVNSVGAFEQYGGPLIVVDIGTATTFDIVDGNGDYLGGVIAPGIGNAENSYLQEYGDGHAGGGDFRFCRADRRNCSPHQSRNETGNESHRHGGIGPNDFQGIQND